MSKSSYNVLFTCTGHSARSIMAETILNQQGAAPDAPHMNFVLKFWDKADGEVCPVRPGQPMSAHWGVEDPVLVKVSEPEIRRAFSDTFMVLCRLIALLTALSIEKLDKLALTTELADIGRIKS